MRRFIGLDVHKAYVYGYELQEKGTGRTFRFPNAPIEPCVSFSVSPRPTRL